jgi:nicotinamidase-related amidase
MIGAGCCPRAPVAERGPVGFSGEWNRRDWFPGVRRPGAASCAEWNQLDGDAHLSVFAIDIFQGWIIKVNMAHPELPVPPHFDAAKVGTVWKVNYQDRAAEAARWAKEHQLTPAAEDTFRLCLVAVDVQNTFCLPEFELFVGGRSGTGAVDDSRRLCEFIYRNLGVITRIAPTMDTHQAVQIFHSIFLVNNKGEHPAPYTLVSERDIQEGRWKVNPSLCGTGHDLPYLERHLLHYAKKLKERGKYDLTIWPYHGMLGGIGHALVPSFEEAAFFHSIARSCQPNFQIKGHNPLTEHYSALGPEVLEGPDGVRIAEKNNQLIRQLMDYDAIMIAGQAKSHCVAWTIEDLWESLRTQDVHLAEKVYLLEDCTSPVVIPAVFDYTDQADDAFRRFARLGMHVVRSTDPLDKWPGLRL